MSELTQTPTPPLTGVKPVQLAAAEVVSELPDELKNAGGISPYPVTSMIESLRQEAVGIRGDAPLLLLKSLVQSLEQKALVQDAENRTNRAGLDEVQSHNTKLSVENAVLQRDVEHKDSDKNARTAFVALGGLGSGVAIPSAISAPGPSSIFYAALFVVIFLGGLFYPNKGRANQ
jgi:hypothetical protein